MITHVQALGHIYTNDIYSSIYVCCTWLRLWVWVRVVCVRAGMWTHSQKCIHTCTLVDTCLGRRCRATAAGTATHCNTLQHIATHCITLHHIASHCITLQHIASHCNTLQHTATHCNTLQHIAAHCNTLQHIATHCNTLQHMHHTASRCKCMLLYEMWVFVHLLSYHTSVMSHTAWHCHTLHCNALHHTTTQYHTLQHAAICCNTL